MKTQSKTILIPCLFLASACSGGGPVDIGDDAVARTGDKLSDYAATWEGYVEASSFRSGSDRIRMALDEEGQGTIELGEAAPLPPPTDSDAFYPDPNARLATGPSFELHEGFAYTVLDALVEGKRLQLRVNGAELYRAWCELQTPEYVEDTDSFSCLPGGYDGGGQRDGHCYLGDADDVDNRLEVPCAKLMFCAFTQSCDCTAGACTVDNARARAGANFGLDAALEGDGDVLDGTLTGVGRVRMTRQ